MQSLLRLLIVSAQTTTSEIEDCETSQRRQGKQEAPLTLRGQRGRCRNIKGEPQIFLSFLSPRPRPLFLWVWFYGGSWET